MYKTFGRLNRFNVTANMSVVTQEQFPDIVSKHVWCFQQDYKRKQISSVIFSEFIRNIFVRSRSDVALIVDRRLKNGYVTSSNQISFLAILWCSR
jgi:hypothetical protein